MRDPLRFTGLRDPQRVTEFSSELPTTEWNDFGDQDAGAEACSRSEVIRRKTVPSTPFTNFPDVSPPYDLASSIASLMATFGGTSDMFKSSKIATRRTLRSTVASWATGNWGAAEPRYSSTRTWSRPTPLTSWTR